MDAPENTLRFAYGDRRYEKMTKDLVTESDILQLKTLEEINLDFSRGDFINLALLSSDLLDALVKHFRNPLDSIRELASRAVVRLPLLFRNSIPFEGVFFIANNNMFAR